MKVCKLIPNQYLRPYISRYWIWENETALPKIFSGTGTELMFHYGEPPSGIEQMGEKITLPQSYFMSPRMKYCRLNSPKKLGFISVRFRAGAFRHFCNTPCIDIVDSFVDIEDLWGRTGQKFEQQVLEAKNLCQRINIIEKFLMKFLMQYGKNDQYVDMAVKKLLYNYKTVSIKGISRDSFLSQRQMERKFKSAVGVSPKIFQRISRFEAVMKKLLLQQEKNYLPVILDHGYYDQSHFLKEFKSYLGEYPASFLQEKNFMSHFYNESLKY